MRYMFVQTKAPELKHWHTHAWMFAAYLCKEEPDDLNTPAKVPHMHARMFAACTHDCMHVCCMIVQAKARGLETPAHMPHMLFKHSKIEPMEAPHPLPSRGKDLQEEA